MTAQHSKQIYGLKNNKTKILFVANANSSHTHSWIKLLDDAFDIRVFGVGATQTSSGFPYDLVSTATTRPQGGFSKYLGWRTGMLCKKIKNYKSRLGVLEFLSDLSGRPDIWFSAFEGELLASTIKHWKPDIIHTLGIDASALPFQKVRKDFSLDRIGVWVISAWGGSDLDLVCLDPQYAKRLRSVLKECDYFIADNDPAYSKAEELGLDLSKIIKRGKTPGAGGVEVERLRALRSAPPSQQRTILIPKAYECSFSKILPVFEALKLCWEQISPCNIVMTACNDEASAWFRTLPEKIRSCTVIEERISHESLIGIMANSRVVLAPSLIDGIPNTLYESMATGAFPIFSPLETFRNLLTEGENILYAKNLYPNEIAGTLAKVMNDDFLVDSAAEMNLNLVRSIADRSVIRKDIVHFYMSIVD